MRLDLERHEVLALYHALGLCQQSYAKDRPEYIGAKELQRKLILALKRDDREASNANA